MRHRVSELEAELAEARKEADEYHRVNIEGNLQLTNLSNEVLTSTVPSLALFYNNINNKSLFQARRPILPQGPMTLNQ